MHITSRQNERVRRYVEIRDGGAAALPWFVVEGGKLLREVRRSGHEVHQVFVLPAQAAEVSEAAPAELLTITPAVLARLSTLSSPPGVCALCRCGPAPDHPVRLAGRDWLVLDGVQDPGNVGAICRSAEAFGDAGLILLPPAPSPFQEKVIRASAGSSLRVPCWRPPDRAALLEAVRTSGRTLWLLDHTGGIPLGGRPPGGPHTFVIGNEGHGASPEVTAAATGRLRIPIRPSVDSLNAAVAASLLLFRLSDAPP